MKKLLFFLSLMLLLFVLSIKLTNAKEEECGGSKYTNVFKNSTYEINTIMSSLTPEKEFYQFSLENKTSISTPVQYDKFGYIINGQFYVDSYKFEKEGFYNIEVVSYFFDYSLMAYVPESNNVLEKFYLNIIDLSNIEVVTNYFYEDYNSDEEFFSKVKNNFEIKGVSIDEKTKYDIMCCFNQGFYKHTCQNYTFESDGKEYIINIDSKENVDTYYEIKIKSPVTVDLSVLTKQQSNCYLYELYGDTLFMDIQITKPDYLDVNVCLEEDVKVNKEGIFYITYSFTDNFTDSFRTAKRRVYVYNSLGQNSGKPIIKFDGELVYNHFSDITEKSLFDGMMYYDLININDVEIYSLYGVKNYYNCFEAVKINWNNVKEKEWPVGSYWIEYTVYDNQGALYRTERKLTIKDVDAPKILFKYNYIEVDKKDLKNFDISNYYLIIDNFDKNFSETVIQEESENYINYTIGVSDSSLNKASETITVKIVNKNFYQKNIYPFLLKYKNFVHKIFGGK